MQERSELSRYKFADKPIVGDVQRDDSIVVTVIVRPSEPIPTEIEPFSHVSREAFLSRHGPRPTDLDAVARFAGQHKLKATIDRVRRTVVLVGSIGDMEAAFNVKMAMYAVPGGTHRGYAGCASVPKDLAGIVVAVIGLHTGSTPPGTSTSSDDANGHGPKITRRRLDTAAALEKFYRFPAGDGTGQCIAIVEMAGGYRRQDVQAYFKSLGISPQVEDVLVHSAQHVGENRQLSPEYEAMLVAFVEWMNGKGPCNENLRPFFEVTMDVSMVGALAPGAQIRVYFGYDNVRALMYLIEEALFVANPQPSVISISWGFQERQILDDDSDIAAAHLIDELFLSAAQMGVTICCSAGDWGASNQVTDGFPGTGYDVNFPASSPYVLACGGTAIADDGTEVAWNADFPTNAAAVDNKWGKHGATGGGSSKVFKRPPWQRQLRVSGKGVDPARRALPDVAAVADPQCGIRCMMAGKEFPTGGTSAGAPMWAALVARLNQQLGRRVGCLNPILYAHAAGHSGILKDVTVGDNRFSKHDVGFDAGSGWDACTGLGTPNGEALLALLKTLAPAT
jgi:kumamolisin